MQDDLFSLCLNPIFTLLERTSSRPDPVDVYVVQPELRILEYCVAK